MCRLAALLLAAVLVSASPAFAQSREGSEAGAPWIEIQTFSLGARYRIAEDSNGVQTQHQLQEGTTLRARGKVHQSGRYWINTLVSTGGALTSGWNNTGIGTGETSFAVYVKQLFLSATPVSGLDVRVGSVGMVRGEATEVTTFDNDIYLMGERVTLRRPSELYFDEVSVTHGYLGDPDTPNVFERLDRIADSNFWQVLVGKRLHPRAAVSVDWTNAPNGDSLHIGLALRPRSVLSLVRTELYVRTDGDNEWGGAITAERTLPRRAVVSAGYADVDRAISLNGDRYGFGRRVFGSFSMPIARPLSASLFYTRAFEVDDVRVPIGHRFDAVVTFDVLEALTPPRSGAR